MLHIPSPADVRFWASTGSDNLTVDGVPLPTFEYGNGPLGKYTNQSRVVLVLPHDHRVKDFRTIGLWSKTFGVYFPIIELI